LEGEAVKLGVAKGLAEIGSWELAWEVAVNSLSLKGVSAGSWDHGSKIADPAPSPFP
jgi:hypothetical protein